MNNTYIPYLPIAVYNQFNNPDNGFQFAIYPNQINPTGHINLSRLNDSDLSNIFTNHSVNYSIELLNWYSGLSGLKYNDHSNILAKYKHITGVKTDQCTICCEDYKETDKLTVFDCKHQFHDDCIRKWLEIKSVCPLCLKQQ